MSSNANVIELNAKIFNNNLVANNPIKDFLHDIRSPLQALQALVSKHNLSKEKEQEIFEKCLSRIKSLTKSESEQSLAKTNTYCIVNVLNELKSQKALELGIQLNIQVRLNNPWITSSLECGELTNILSNLVNNSFNAGATQRLTIRVRSNQMSQILVEVIDNGSGINLEKLSNIGSYGQTYTKGGQGIGLATAISTLEKKGAQLMCRSIPNSITQFTIILPR